MLKNKRNLGVRLVALFLFLLPFICYSSSDYEVINPKPFSASIFAIWGTGPDNIYYSGWEFIGHWNGSQYSIMNTAKEFPYRGWNSIYGIADDDIMVVGGLGNALHWDGLTWTNVSIPGCNSGFIRVWGAETGEYFVVADHGTVWKYVNSHWYVHEVNYYVWFYDIWGFSADDIYIAGVAPLGEEAVYHWDGTNWMPFGGNTRGWEPYTLKVFASDDLWVAGAGGQIVQWDGTSWQGHDPGDPFYNLYDCWGSSSSDILFAGYRGILRHFDGSNWTTSYLEDPHSPRSIYCLFSFDDSSIYAAGNAGLLYRYNGTDWENMQTGPIDNLNGIWSSSTYDVFAVGDDGIIIKWSSFDWEYMNGGVTDDLHDIWGYSNMAYVVGANGTVLKWNGIAWNEMSSGVATDLFCVRGVTGGGSVFACGANGSVIQYDGVVWNSIPTGYDVNLYGIWAAAENDVYVVGDRVNNQGTVLHWNGTTWTSINTGINIDYRDVFGFSPDDVFILGDGPTILHYNGTNWTEFNLKAFPAGPYNRIGGTSGSNLYVAGDLLLRFDGIKWTMEFASGTIREICTSPNNHVFFAGLGGLLMTNGPYPDPCRETRVSLMMPDHVFAAGDTCWCNVTVCNASGIEMVGTPLFVILDVYGNYFFGPEFTELPNSWLELHPDFAPGETIIEVIPEFTWPENTGSADGIFLYAALTNPEVTEIIGEWDSWEFGW